MSEVFLLDMDGVVTDFVGSVLSLYGKTYEPDRWPRNVYGIEHILGITDNEMWDKVNSVPQFWDNMTALNEGLKLYDELCKIGEVFFATSPSRDPNSSSGKVAWLRKRYGEKFRNYVLSSHKWLMAGNGILIDDDDERISKFRECGGTAIVYPQPWNSQAESVNRQNDYVLEKIQWALLTTKP